MTLQQVQGERKSPYAIIPPMFPPLRRIRLDRFSGRRAAALNFLAERSGLILCALFLLSGVVLAGDYGIGRDEMQQRSNAIGGLNYIRGNAAAIADQSLLSGVDRVYGLAFELPLLLAERALGLADYHYIHRLRLTLTHLFFIIGGYFCYRLAYRLFPNRLIALFALLLYLLHPRLYAHSYFNSKDLPFLAMFSIALYLLERAFRRDTLAGFALLGIAVGALTNLRIMGLMLFPAVIAMRGLDWRAASGGAGRKHILLTGGLFILAGGLTLYALSPYAWTNPLDYLLGGLALTANHPNVAVELFQGQRLLSTEMPPRYGIVWFSITTPPPVLLLGFIGMAMVAAQVIARPGAVFGNTRRRFLMLLLAAFALPLLVVAALDANIFNGWRHLFFVYVPFCLLAAAGLGGLAAALARRPAGRIGIYGLAAAGLGLIILQMAQIHPYQQEYFNFLVNRAEPNYLSARYEMGYWRLGIKEGLEYLAARHPGERLALRANPDAVAILPKETRQYLTTAANAGPADYAVTYQPQPQRPDLAFNAVYRRRVYNNDLVAVMPLKDSRMTAAAAAAYEKFYRQAVAGEPIIQGDYAVYRNGNLLTFVREDCPAEDGADSFAARVYRRPPERPPGYIPDAPLYADFSNGGVRLGRRCLALLQLPDYPIDHILAGQYAAREPGQLRRSFRWAGLHSLVHPGLAEIIAAHRESNPKMADGAAFELYRQGGRLIYYREDCAAADRAAEFFLHIIPENASDLPRARRPYGFANRDFAFARWGDHFDGKCLAVVPLPDYPLREIRTGQYIPGQGEVWAERLAAAP